jgi:hypothetical protein
MISLIAQYAWPATHPIWFKSQVPDLILPVMLWRIYPNAESQKFLSPTHRPTELQLTVPHSPIIDWVYYPQLRDRMIMCYNGNVALDRLMCEYLNSHVIEVDDVAQILPYAPPGRGYFGVWNMYRGIYANGSESEECATTSLRLNIESSGAFSSVAAFGREGPVLDYFVPATSQTPKTGNWGSEAFSLGASSPRSVVELLATPASALRLSHELRLYAAKSWRLDPSFFKAWPELKFEGYERIVAQGRSYRIPLEPPDSPIPMTEATVKIYNEELAGIN